MIFCSKQYNKDLCRILTNAAEHIAKVAKQYEKLHRKYQLQNLV